MEENNNVPQQPQNNNGKGMAIAALVLGIVAAAICWFGWSSILGLVLGIVAIVLAVKARNALKGADGAGLATAGLVLGIIGVVLSGIAVICWICALAAVGAIANQLGDLSNISINW